MDFKSVEAYSYPYSILECLKMPLNWLKTKNDDRICPPSFFILLAYFGIVAIASFTIFAIL